jgi:hypothetical protein
MHQKTAAVPVVDWPQTCGGHVSVETQRGRVFYQQILSRVLARLSNAQYMWVGNRIMGDVGFGEQTVSGTQTFPVAKGCRQGAGWFLSQSAAHPYKALGAPTITQLDVAHFFFSPNIGARQQFRIRHIPPACQVYKFVQ